MKKCPRELSEEEEKKFLSRYATPSTHPLYARREFPQDKDPFRTEFHRDYTRIIHSRAFRRLRHKTQVFISPNNDHLCTRMEHSLHVASIGRTVSKALHLNNELVAAIAVGHDVGHAPFGHWGEKCLNKLGKDYDISFGHEIHSLRVVDRLDSTYPEHRGLNLTFAVRDGIASHYGEGFEKELTPDRKKRPRHLKTVKRGQLPATVEGCVVRWVDKVSYLGRDLEDALTVGIVKEDEIPRKVRETLGITNREIIGALVAEIVEHSSRNSIAVGNRVHDALNTFYNFNMKRIYQDERVTRHYGQVERAMDPMFKQFLHLIEEARDRNETTELFPGRKEKCIEVLAAFLKDDVRSWREENPAQLAIDYIAGMTDNFFIFSLRELFFPRATA